jgi:hypothetical protein
LHERQAPGCDPPIVRERKRITVSASLNPGETVFVRVPFVIGAPRPWNPDIGSPMQFLESSMLGVRSARLSFANRALPVRITLFPMVHVGEAEFYDLTYRDARDHDVVFLEGVRSPITTRVTRSYRWLVGSKAMAGLVVQPRFPRDAATARIVHADLSAEEFEREWRAVPIWLRAAVYVQSPLVGLQRRCGPRDHGGPRLLR